MDMDIPMQDELEWLEANSHINDDYDDFEEPPQPYPDDEEELELEPQPQNQQPTTKPTLALPPKPTQTTNQSLQPNPQIKKRFRSDLPDSPNPENADTIEDKRSRIDVSDPEIDENWLRYSPPRAEAPIAEEEAVVVVVVEEEVEKIVSRYASEIDGDFVPVTGPAGDRVYAKINGVEKEGGLKKLDVKLYSKGLISEPIDVLMQKVEHDALMKALDTSVEGQNDVILPETHVATEQLWVDKYAPSSFMELLSDEQTNREVLLWLKQWDSCVFGSEIRSTNEEVLSSLRRHSSVVQRQKFSERSVFGKKMEFRQSKETSKRYSDLDQENTNSIGLQELWNKKSKGTGPPEQKILLLCGPPGLGKTTLAHVAARHCGYRVVEINASDDRSSATVEAKILNVVQMNSVMADAKPKCLIIDEIDGALGDGKGAVEVLLKMVSAERKSDTGKDNAAKEQQSGRVSSQKKRKNASLSRPVICICNDLYAPALRPLRQVAKVHIFVQPTITRVVTRLKHICNKEGLKTSSIALTALAEYTECDIRSCLHTLQFLNKKKETLHVLDISSQVVGRKDASKSALHVWKEIFQKRKAKPERKSTYGGGRISDEFESLYSLISNRGDYDFILDGIHENILQLHYHDPMLQKTVKCFNSLGVSDILHQYVMRTQKMSLQVYQPAIAIAVRRLIAQVEKPQIEWPKSFQRYRTMWMKNMDSLRSWYNKLSPYISRHMSTKSFVEDSVSPILHILSPPTLRPVALHLLSEKEKNDLVQLVNKMVSYGMTYKNTKSDTPSGTLRNEAALDTLVLSLDPPIGDFINFTDYRSGHFVLALAVKQVLVHEVEKQKILHGSTNRSMHPVDAHNEGNQVLVGEEKGRTVTSTFDRAPATSDENSKNPSKSRQCTSNSSTVSLATGSTESATAAINIRPPKDIKKPSGGSASFFDRFRKLSSSGSQNTDSAMKKPATLERDSRPLLFKFNEGFTNAVKRPVRIRDFFL